MKSIELKVSKENARVQAIANAIWTEQVISDFQARNQSNNP
jgi:hypothetical protein